MAALQRRGLQTRILSSEEEEKLKRDQALVSDFKQQKLEKEAQKNWDLFYKRNSTNFFKDRHWTTREFEELRSCREFEDQKLTMLEAGCGVGNCLFPLLEEDPDIFAYACDFSPRAVEYVKQNPLYDTERCKVFQCDLTKDDLLEHVPPESVDVVTLIFVLSAVHPDKMHLVLQNIYKTRKHIQRDGVICLGSFSQLTEELAYGSGVPRFLSESPMRPSLPSENKREELLYDALQILPSSF
ncbi:tRNA N(3)-cytidine methyltransferase METTL6 isoform 3-T4 [Dama dama]|uniref:tRNA N(3)-methylcytidine methyltransferase METTL6 isoform X5 n=1 Tax=Dama dama TaxID=30532 RepID=UPI002A368703|nr:tRNA N(3)-methylcytidine methyltransferase METTL6 isoform X5 [Dama dama]